jgi:hypothetical protein
MLQRSRLELKPLENWLQSWSFGCDQISEFCIGFNRTTSGSDQNSEIFGLRKTERSHLELKTLSKPLARSHLELKP